MSLWLIWSLCLIWSILTFIAVIWVIYDALFKNESLSKLETFFWIIIALILGVIGAILYYFLGKEESEYNIHKGRR